MTITKIKTQAQLDKAIKDGEREFEFAAKGEFEISLDFEWIKVSVAAALKWDVLVKAWGSSRVEAWGSSRVEAWGSSRVEARGSSRVVAWESSSVVARESSRVEARGSSRVEAWGSSSVEARESSRVEARGSSRVVAWESSSVVARESSRVEARGSSRVVAWESSSVVARESSRVEARGYCSIHLWGNATAELTKKCHAFLHSRMARLKGGKKTEAYIEDSGDWLEYHGIEVKDGIAVLYKSVNGDFSSGWDNKFFYHPGTSPKASGWDKQECSKGLHFCPSPRHARGFHQVDNNRFIACPVAVADLLWRPNWNMSKAKAPKLAAPCWEVDIDGNPVKAEKAA